MLPQGLLSSNIPNVELELVVSQVLDVEALGWGDSANVLTQRTAYLIR